MIVTVCAKHEPYWDTGHIGAVVEEMRIFGAPTIRVMERNGCFCALEGSHRLHAAAYLGMEPNLVVEIVDLPDYIEDDEFTVVKLPAVTFDHAHVLDLREFDR